MNNAANAGAKSKRLFLTPKTQIKQIAGTDMVKHVVEHGWGELWRAHSAEVILPGSHSVNVVNVELFGVGVIPWNTINLSNLLRLCSDCQHAERPTHAPGSVSEPVENVCIPQKNGTYKETMALDCDTLKWANQIIPTIKCSSFSFFSRALRWCIC